MLLLMAGRGRTNRIRVVQTCLDRTRDRSYLEIGVEHGVAFAQIRARRKIAVDPHIRMTSLQRKFCEGRAQETHYCELLSDDFFASRQDLLAPGISVALVDGLHTYEQSLRDVENILAYLQDDGVIVLHDCNPRTATIGYPAASYEEFKANTDWRPLNPLTWRWSGDVWKTIAHLRATRDDLEVAVLDADRGIGLVRRGVPTSRLSLTPLQIERLSYHDLDSDRARLLNLRPPEYLQSFLNAPGAVAGTR